MAAFKIGIIGAGGRMGQSNLRQVAATDGCVVAAASEVAGHPALGRDAGELAGIGAIGVAIGADARAVFAAADAVLEFSSPRASADHAAMAAETGTAQVIGTTGLEAAELDTIRRAAERAAIVHAPNMSLAVTILVALTGQVARLLDDEFDIEVLEMHHRHKVDAPSGTALALGRAAAVARGVTLDAAAQKIRDGLTGPRPRGGIGFASLRGGDVVGDHTVIFAADGERLELTHKASSRQIFSRGAVRAALWTKGKPPGLYSMVDVLGLS